MVITIAIVPAKQRINLNSESKRTSQRWSPTWCCTTPLTGPISHIPLDMGHSDLFIIQFQFHQLPTEGVPCMLSHISRYLFFIQHGSKLKLTSSDTEPRNSQLLCARILVKNGMARLPPAQARMPTTKGGWGWVAVPLCFCSTSWL